METNKIEIKLDYAEESYVSLDNMSLKALESFLTVTNSLKNIAETVSTDITFTIKKGSAYTAVNGNSVDIRAIYDKIDEAIDGESDDEIVTSNLRSIQKEIQNQVFNYQFIYANKSIDNKIRSAKKIQKKRSKNLYKNELTILSGYFNSIGGNDPNYHFDYGAGQRTIVDCTIPEAIELKNYLYQTISCLVQKKFVINDNENTSYLHCSILKNEQVRPFRDFIKQLNETNNLLERLDYMYDFVDSSQSKIDDMFVLLKSYKYFFEDINEYKTLLILSRNFTENSDLKKLRESLLIDFENQMNKI